MTADIGIGLAAIDPVKMTGSFRVVLSQNGLLVVQLTKAENLEAAAGPDTLTVRAGILSTVFDIQEVVD